MGGEAIALAVPVEEGIRLGRLFEDALGAAPQLGVAHIMARRRVAAWRMEPQRAALLSLMVVLSLTELSLMAEPNLTVLSLMALLSLTGADRTTTTTDNGSC